MGIYNEAGIEQLSLVVGSNVTFTIRNTAEEGQTELLQVEFISRVNDANWHRLALSVKGDSVTLLTDCTAQQTRSLPREPDSELETNGIAIVGTTLLNNIHFEGDVQHIFFIPSPDAAYEQCYDYLPECAQPYPYEDLDNGHEDNGNGYYNGNNGAEDHDSDEDTDNIDGSTDGDIDGETDSDDNETRTRKFSGLQKLSFTSNSIIASITTTTRVYRPTTTTTSPPTITTARPEITSIRPEPTFRGRPVTQETEPTVIPWLYSVITGNNENLTTSSTTTTPVITEPTEFVDQVRTYRYC